MEYEGVGCCEISDEKDGLGPVEMSKRSSKKEHSFVPSLTVTAEEAPRCKSPGVAVTAPTRRGSHSEGPGQGLLKPHSGSRGSPTHSSLHSLT